MHVLQLTESQLTTLATVLNKLPEREYHHAALFSVHLVVEAQWKRARRPAKRARVSGAEPPSRLLSVSDSFISVLKDMVQANSWWDTVDTLSKTIGYLVQVYPHLADEMEAWSKDEDFWVRRVSLLHQVRRGSPAATHQLRTHGHPNTPQLAYKDETDTDALFRRCAAMATEEEFFIRKAIGWALRTYSRVDADAVARFVADHPELSPLSKREALRLNLHKKR